MLFYTNVLWWESWPGRSICLLFLTYSIQYSLVTQHFACEAKHALAYGYGGRDYYRADMTETYLFDVYAKPWRDFLRKAGGRGLMVCVHSTMRTGGRGPHGVECQPRIGGQRGAE